MLGYKFPVKSIAFTEASKFAVRACNKNFQSDGFFLAGAEFKGALCMPNSAFYAAGFVSDFSAADTLLDGHKQ